MKAVYEYVEPQRVVVIMIFLLFVSFAVGYYVGHRDGIIKAFDIASEYAVNYVEENYDCDITPKPINSVGSNFINLNFTANFDNGT